MDNRISRIPRPIVDESALPNVSAVAQPNVMYANAPNIIETLQNLDVPESQTEPATIQTTSTPITASNPLNGVLVTLATLGVITASAGALTMTSTALAKKREQDEAKSAQMATLHVQQSAQVQSAGANWAENQAMQVSAKQAVMTQVTQSQANKDFWSAYTQWKIKVAEAKQKRREDALKTQSAIKQQSAPLAKATQSSELGFVGGLLKLLKWGVHFIREPEKTASALLTGSRLNANGIKLGGEHHWLDWNPAQILSVSDTTAHIIDEYQSASENNPYFQETIGGKPPIDLFKEIFGSVEIRLGETADVVFGTDHSLMILPLDPINESNEIVYNGFNQLLIQKIETVTGSNPNAEGDSGIDDETVLKYSIAQNTELFHWTSNFRAEWGETTGYGETKTIWELLNDGDAIAKLDVHYLADIQANPDDPKNIFGYMYLAQRGVDGGADWFIRNTFLPLVDVKFETLGNNNHPNADVGFNYNSRIKPENLVINGLHDNYTGTTLEVGIQDETPSQYGWGEESYGNNACGPFNVFGILNYYNRYGRLNADYLNQGIPSFDDYYSLIADENYYDGDDNDGVGIPTTKNDASNFVQRVFGLNVITTRQFVDIPTDQTQLLRLISLDIPPVMLVGLVDTGNKSSLDNNLPTEPSYGTIGNIDVTDVPHFVVLSGFSSPRQWELGQQWVRVENPFLNTTEYYTWQDFQYAWNKDRTTFWIDPNSTPMPDESGDEITQWGDFPSDGFPPIPYQPIESYQIPDVGAGNE